ncbi:MAG: YihY family inner membrane protein, partial [Gammaproteobacteria bacterium]
MQPFAGFTSTGNGARRATSGNPERRVSGTRVAAPTSTSAALLNLLRTMSQQARALRLAEAAGSLAFLSLIAIVPMFTIAFAVLTALPVFDRMREGLQGFLNGNLFPTAFSETLLSHLNEFASKAGELSLVGSGVFFVTAFTVLLTVEVTLNRIWGADRQRPLTLRLTLYWALLTLGPLLLATSITANGIVMSSWLRGRDLRELRGLWLVLVPWLTTFSSLILLYRLVPATHVRWRDAIIGALLASLLVELMRRLFAIYVANLPTYTVVYGAFAALPMFLLWLFLGWTSLLVGALLAANLRWWRHSAVAHTRGSGDRFDDARAVLSAMAKELGDRRDAALPARRLQALFDGDPQRALESATLLASLGYLTRFVTLVDVVPAEE